PTKAPTRAPARRAAPKRAVRPKPTAAAGCPRGGPTTMTDTQTSPSSPPAAPAPGRLPALYLSHGAPTLVDDPLWPGQLAASAASLPRPTAILVVSAHWEAAPLTIGATSSVPLVYDFYGFPERYYRVTYPAPGAPELAERVRRLVADLTPTA